jgi:hypothetical protein
MSLTYWVDRVENTVILVSGLVVTTDTRVLVRHTRNQRT